jgi:hypothetical protein
MRSNLLVGISSAVAAVAMAGSASAGLASGKIDGFRGSFSGWTPNSFSDGTQGADLVYNDSTLGFNSRGLLVQGLQKTSGSGSTQKKLWTTAQVNDAPAGGDQVQALVKAGNANGASGITTNANGVDHTYVGFLYSPVDADYNNVAFDMSNAASFTVSFANNTFGTVGTNLRFTVQLGDLPTTPGQLTTYWGAEKSVSGSSGTLTFNAADFGAGAAAQWTNLGSVELYVEWDTPSGRSAGTTLGTVTLTDFSYNAAVPAPGAAALVGMAGLISARRRKA